MSAKRSIFSLLTLCTACAAFAQTAATPQGGVLYPDVPLATVSSWFAVGSGMAAGSSTVQPADGAQALLQFNDADIKFSLNSLTELLRDHRHEGWVLAAYPDPNTRRPLIGAGFSLDLPARTHVQSDPFNPHPFLEPSSAELWQAAGLDPQRLEAILADFDRNVNRWSPHTYRHRIVRQLLTPQLTEEEGQRLLRISAIQAVYNARAYCRNFDELTGAQQMALSQLVFQMGVNLEQFVSFRQSLNDPHGLRELPQLDGYMESEAEHWKTVQTTLMESQWARRYSVRAASVIAMFDPQYHEEPGAAEERVYAVLHPPVLEAPHERRPAATVRVASYSKHSARGRSRKPARAQVKRKLT